VAAPLGLVAPYLMVACGRPELACIAAIIFVVVFPGVLARHGEQTAAMRRARRVHRWASLVTGALLFALVHRGDAARVPILAPLVGALDRDAR
jgi:hypothetical protein